MFSFLQLQLIPFVLCSTKSSCSSPLLLHQFCHSHTRKHPSLTYITHWHVRTETIGWSLYPITVRESSAKGLVGGHRNIWAFSDKVSCQVHSQLFTGFTHAVRTISKVWNAHMYQIISPRWDLTSSQVKRLADRQVSDRCLTCSPSRFKEFE